MDTWAYYSESAYKVYSKLPLQKQKEIESIRLLGLKKLVDSGKAEISDNTAFPVIYKNDLPAVGFALKYYIREADGIAAIVDIQPLHTKP